MRTFVAIGDSFTEGLHDEVRADGRHSGWADRLAHDLAVNEGGLRYANLAVRGRLLAQVLAEQVPAALELRPDLVSFHAGPNDVLRPNVDLPQILRRYDETVERLRAAGSQVLLLTVIGRESRSGRIADALARRFHAFNETVRGAAERYGAVLVDLASVAVLSDSRLWNEDRLHLNSEGHRRVAAAARAALAGTADENAWWREPLPEQAPLPRPRALAVEARWVGRHLLPWIGRRLRGVSSGDAVVPKQVEPVTLPTTQPS